MIRRLERERKEHAVEVARMAKAGALIALVGVLLVGCSSSDLAPPAAFEDCEDQALATLAVTARVAQDAYRPGQVATFKVLVMRAVQTDDHGDGASQEVGPVEGAEVALGATVGDVRLAGGGTTDEFGKTTIKVTVARYVPAGVADVLVSATADSVDLECVPHESGHVEKPGLFRVVR